MELLNIEIHGAVNALNKIFEMELPVRTSLDLAKLIGKLSGPFQAIEKVRVGLVGKYGVQNPKTNQTEVSPTKENAEGETVRNEDFPKFMEEYGELMNQKTEIVFDIVKLPQVVNGEPFTLKAGLLVPLQKFVEIEPLTVVK